MITVALAKGALLKDSVARFEAAGLNFSAVLDPDLRKESLTNSKGKSNIVTRLERC